MTFGIWTREQNFLVLCVCWGERDITDGELIIKIYWKKCQAGSNTAKTCYFIIKAEDFQFLSFIMIASSLLHNRNIWKWGIWRSNLHGIFQKCRPTQGRGGLTSDMPTGPWTPCRGWERFTVALRMLSTQSRKNSRGKSPPPVFFEHRRHGTKLKFILT